jgi:hypothetical protein
MAWVIAHRISRLSLAPLAATYDRRNETMRPGDHPNMTAESITVPDCGVDVPSHDRDQGDAPRDRVASIRGTWAVTERRR